MSDTVEIDSAENITIHSGADVQSGDEYATAGAILVECRCGHEQWVSDDTEKTECESCGIAWIFGR